MEFYKRVLRYNMGYKINPDNQVNYKLTLNLKELKEITNLIKELERILELD